MQPPSCRYIAAGAILAILLGGFSHAQEAPPRAVTVWPGLSSSGAVVLPNGWSLDPAGRQIPLGDFPILIAECPAKPVLAILHAGYGPHEIITTDASSARVIARVTIPETFGGLAWSADGGTLFVGGGTTGVIHRFDHADGLLSNRRELRLPATAQGPHLLAGIALADDDLSLWVADAFAHALYCLDTETGNLVATVPTGELSYPYGLAIDQERDRLYASLWAKAEVAVIDIAAREIKASWPTQEHPNELLLSKNGKTLFVANANRNTVSVIDAEGGKPLETIGTAISPRAPSGCTPNSLSLTPDEQILLVANANTNDVAVINVSQPGQSKPLGFVPSGWYPTCVRASRDGKTIHIANGKGGSSRANRDGPNPLIRSRSIREYIGGLYRGTLSLVPIPNPAQLASYSLTVYACSPLDRNNPTAVKRGRPEGSPIPARAGDPSPITHCVYIVKENRTYDQVFGDLPQGNGEPALCLFPEEVTPNHHALAQQFVVLDNFYVESEVSADGHEWSMAAYATDYVERTWPLNYRGNSRIPYPAEGSLKIAEPSGGYIWDKAREKGVSYFSFGEFIDNPAQRGQPATTKMESLQGHFDPLFWSYDLDVPDQERADRFIEVLKEWNEKGEMPRLVILRLPNDHTSGTSRGKPTPTAMVADNDLALGRVVESLSQSKFWPGLAIFVVEDDAQNGSDHVDAHRTVALAVSPYIRRQSVDSTLYSTSSMLRTMELVLGLDPMSQFDAAATPMWASFHSQPDLAPYTHLPARVDLKATNTASAWGADASEKLDLAREDAADDLIFNEIIWKAVKGPDSMMPPPVRAAFVRPAPDDDDDDDDEEAESGDDD